MVATTTPISDYNSLPSSTHNNPASIGATILLIYTLYLKNMERILNDYLQKKKSKASQVGDLVLVWLPITE